MFIAMAFLIGCIIGFGLGFFCYRNNAKRLQDDEAAVVDILCKFKGDKP